MSRVRLILLTLVALTLFTVSDAAARILSYAPVSTRYARPAVQPRDASHYLLLESPDMPFWGSPIMGPVMPSYQPRGQLVLHHATGEQEPRVVLSRDGQYDMIGLFAMNETPDGVRHYLVMTNPESTSGTTAPLPPATPPPPPPGTIVYPPGTPPLTTSPYPLPRYLYSNDDGATWKVLDLPDVLGTQDFLRQDIGGTVTRGRGSQIRLGTSETPFIFGAAARNQAGASTVFYAVDKGGAVRPLIEMAADFSALLIGSNRTGSQLLIAGAPIVNSVAQPTGIRILDLDGTLEDVLPLSSTHPQMEGWITSSGAVYLEETGPNLATQRVSYIDGGAGNNSDGRAARLDLGRGDLRGPDPRFRRSLDGAAKLRSSDAPASPSSRLGCRGDVEGHHGRRGRGGPRGLVRRAAPDSGPSPPRSGRPRHPRSRPRDLEHRLWDAAPL
jgi:hypothetical protein